MKLNIQDTFNKELPADPERANARRQVQGAAFSYVTPRIPTNPALVHTSAPVGNLLGMTPEDLLSEEFLRIFSGAKLLTGTSPYAMAYAGHQFGNWAGQLGDGRAINLFEVNHAGKQWAVQLKGSGATPYSRSADGLAVLRSSVREHLCSEAMAALGVPSTRSLSLILTGDQVLRDMLYDGHPAYEPGAVVCRVAPSFIRFGNFELFASRKDLVNLRRLTDYTIQHFYPEIQLAGKESYVAFFQLVAKRTLDMIVHWERVGFVHGVMNTDNMSILGLTIDYGPYGWLEGYDPNWTPNTTDRQHRRYRFGQQADIALWNLYQLANALYPLIEEAAPIEKVLEDYRMNYAVTYHEMMQGKLGLFLTFPEDVDLIDQLEALLQRTETDMTLFFRNLSKVDRLTWIDEGKEFLKPVWEAFYAPQDLVGPILQEWRTWMNQYIQRLNREQATDDMRKESMNSVNPKYVLRNYMAQLAIDAADKGDYSLVEELYQLLQHPYEEQPASEKWFVKRPEWARQKVGCSMLSCSS